MRQLLNAQNKKNIVTAPLSSRPLVNNNSPLSLEKALRTPRSAAYMDAVRQLDAGTHQHNLLAIDQLKQQITAELPNIALEMLLGIVSKCYLGHSYEVHTLDFFGQIIEHYKIGEPMKGELEKARNLARHETYQCIEVYSNRLVAISKDGKASIIEG